MNNDEIGHAMKRMPRTNASPRFTSDVLRRLEERRNNGHAWVAWHYAAALAMMLCVAVLAFETSTVHARRQRLDALRAERQRIETELQQVKAIADDPRPVVVLENDNTRVIVPVAVRRSANAAQQPIIY
jgi:hypothetical protein